MDLVSGFRLKNNSRIALVGSGGKTTLMFQLARDYQTRVILTTTTHLAQDQLLQADHRFEINQTEDILALSNQDPAGVIMITGPEVEPNRVSGPTPELLLQIRDLADLWSCPLLIESDGARKLPLKAPAEHEPAIPDFVDIVITVIGLSGLGQPLSEKWVHRPELFSKLVDLELGVEIHSHHLVKALISEQGGLKNIPAGARRLLMINQIDSFPNWKTFHDQLDLLLDAYEMVAFGVLEDQLILEIQQRVAGIILAAGGSARFGEPKQLLDWKGKTLVKHAVDLALGAGLRPVIVVSGAAHQQISDVLDERVQIVHNPHWEHGQSTSVRAGVESLPGEIGAAVFLLVDQPLIPEELIRLLRQKHSRSLSRIIHPDVDGTPGNPVLFDRQVFEDLKGLVGDQGGRVLFDSYPPQKIDWHDPASQYDIDSPQDYQNLSSSY